MNNHMSLEEVPRLEESVSPVPLEIFFEMIYVLALGIVVTHGLEKAFPQVEHENGFSWLSANGVLVKSPLVRGYDIRERK